MTFLSPDFCDPMNISGEAGKCASWQIRGISGRQRLLWGRRFWEVTCSPQEYRSHWRPRHMAGQQCEDGKDRVGAAVP